MEEKKEIKISLNNVLLIIAIVIICIMGVVIYKMYSKDNTESGQQDVTENIATNYEKTDINLQESNEVKEENKVDNNSEDENKENDYFILYNGFEMSIRTGLQEISDMEITDSTNKKYNRIYYNYEERKYIGTSEGIFGEEETYEGYSYVENVRKIAISKRYDAIPRNATTIKKLPEQLSDYKVYDYVDIEAIDLDGDNRKEYIVCSADYTERTSMIELYNSDFTTSYILATSYDAIQADVGGTPATFNSSDVTYIDIDNDGVMEIIIELPSWEGYNISVVKYNKGTLEGEKDLKVEFGGY